MLESLANGVHIINDSRRIIMDNSHSGKSIVLLAGLSHDLLPVDDEPFVVPAQERMLHDQGYNILTASKAGDKQ